MTGLRILDIFMSFRLDLPLPDALFDLQRVLKAVREFSISMDRGYDGGSDNREMQMQRVRRFERLVQRRLFELKQAVAISYEEL